MRWAVLIALTCGAVAPACGRIAGQDEGGIADQQDDGIVDGEVADAGVRCTDQAFGPAAAITELDTSLDDRDLRLTPDERIAIFHRLPSANAPKQPGFGLYVSARSSPGAPFGPAILQHADPSSASLRADGLEAFYMSGAADETRIGLVGNTRASTTDIFGPIHQFFAAAPDQNSGPFEFGLDWGDGYVTADTLSYYLMLRLPADAGANASSEYGVYLLRHSVNPSDGGVYQTFTAPGGFVARPPDGATFLDYPIVTSDELTLYVSVQSPSGAARHIEMATRATTGDPFGPLTPLHELDSAEGEYPTWISVDQCRLYFTRRVGGQWDLYVASRAP